MKQQQTNKHSNLHREDQHITVEELWKGWKLSEGETETAKSTSIRLKRVDGCRSVYQMNFYFKLAIKTDGKYIEL